MFRTMLRGLGQQRATEEKDCALCQIKLKTSSRYLSQNFCLARSLAVFDVLDAYVHLIL